MRRDRILLALVTAASLAAAGCGTTPERSAEPRATSSPSATAGGTPSPEPGDTRVPVAKAGGLCGLLSYRAVAQATGAEFDVAAAGDEGASCVLQVQGHRYPDLTLSAAETKADEENFGDTVPPEGASDVDGLGEAAYRVVRDPADGSGPRAEVGWLADGKIYTLRYSYETGVSKAQARQMTEQLVGFAKRLKTG